MADWDELKGSILAVLTEGLDEYIGEHKEETEEFLKKKAEQLAEWKWKQITAQSDEDKWRATQMLEHLEAHVALEVASLAMAANKQAKGILTAVLKVAVSAVKNLI